MILANVTEFQILSLSPNKGHTHKVSATSLFYQNFTLVQKFHESVVNLIIFTKWESDSTASKFKNHHCLVLAWCNFFFFIVQMEFQFLQKLSEGWTHALSCINLISVFHFRKQSTLKMLGLFLARVFPREKKMKIEYFDYFNMVFQTNCFFFLAKMQIQIAIILWFGVSFAAISELRLVMDKKFIQRFKAHESIHLHLFKRRYFISTF